MRKILKIITSIVLLAICIFLLTGCGKAKSKISQYSNENYYIKFKTEENNSILEFSKDGKNYALKTEDGRFVEKDVKQYAILEEEKLMYVTEGVDYNSLESMSEMDLYKKQIIQEEDVNKSTETIDGVKYECEEVNGMKFYFLDGKIKIYKEVVDGETSTVEVLEYDNKAKNELFNIPTDYEIIEE